MSEGKAIREAWDSAEKEHTAYFLFWTYSDCIFNENYGTQEDAQSQAEQIAKVEGHKVLAIKEITYTEGEGLK